MSEPGLLKFELVTEEPAVLVANTIYFVKNSTVNRIVISGNLPQDPLRVTSTTALESIASKLYIASGNTKEEARNSIDAAAINHTHPEASGTVPGFLSTALYTKLMGLSNYVHPTSDGNLHVPATGTTNNGKVLKAGATAGSMSWGTLNKSDVGLNNVDNTTDAAKPVSTAQASAIATAKSEAATDATSKANAAQAAAIAASTPVAHVGTGGTSHANATTTVAGFMSETDKTKLDGIAAGAQVNTVNSVAGKTGVVTLVKADVGLGNVDNTTDAAKPVSTATQTALNLKSNLVSPTFTGTPSAPTAPVNTNTTQLATTAFVNAEIANDAAPIAHVGSTGAAHGVVTTTVAGFMSAADKTKLDGIAAGAQTNAVNSVAGKTGVVTLVKADVGLNNVDNTSDAAKPVSTAQATAISGAVADAATDATNKANAAQSAAIAASTPSSHAGSTGSAHGVATTAVHGFMSSTDKSKLDGIAAGATANTGTVTGVTATLPIVSSGGTAPIISINAATTSAAGSMSAADKTKLDGITGTNTGDETTATIKSKLGITTLSGVNTGDQTTITGNAGTATKLQTARTINGVAFDGSANITINAVDSTARIAASEKGAANGVATLVDGKVPLTQLPEIVASESTTLINISYENRGDLRTTVGTHALIEGLGLFAFYEGSDEPDDDESCFATSTGRWLLDAVSWDVVDVWQLPETEWVGEQIEDIYNKLPNNFLRKSQYSFITSISAFSTVTVVATVPGASVGDAVLASSPFDMGTFLNYTAVVSNTNTVSIYIKNSSGETKSTPAGTWKIIVFKE